jgi:hypothetical protein
MSYLVTDLLNDTMQRVGRLKNEAGITFLNAANSVQSMLVKKLLERKSDLLASNTLSLMIPAEGYKTTLPSGFISMAEKPMSKENFVNWISGVITGVSDTLVLGASASVTIEISSFGGDDTINSWNIGSVVLGMFNSLITSVTSVDMSAVSVSDLVTLNYVSTGVSLFSVTDVLFIYSPTMSTSTNIARRTLQPNYLNSDEEHDVEWWTNYGLYGWEWEVTSRSTHFYKIIDTYLYIRPRASCPITIKGKYFGLPSQLTNSSTIPFNGLFDEVFRAGIVRILQKGIEIPESDQDFNYFLNREFDSVINARMNILGTTRTHHSNFM